MVFKPAPLFLETKEDSLQVTETVKSLFNPKYLEVFQEVLCLLAGSRFN